MKLAYDNRGFRVVPSDNRYPGYTEYKTKDGRYFACMGVGEEVERLLIEKSKA